jgi:Calcineurin-like phosphoesterase
MPQKTPAQVCWIFAPEDESIARELMSLAAVLELQSLIKNWSPLDVLPGQSLEFVASARLSSADVIMAIGEDELVRRPEWLELIDELLLDAPVPRWVGVRLRNASFPPGPPNRMGLPRDGIPLLARRDRQQAMLDVILALQELVTFKDATPRQLRPVSVSRDPSELTINEVFQLNGAPSINFVEPPRFDELKLELRTMGTGLIVEGPSRVGKSTAVKKAMEALGIPTGSQIWWDGRTFPEEAELQQKLRELEAATEKTWLFIDDFHYVEDARSLRALAFCMKGIADQGPRSNVKITLIGINPLGGSLVQAMPDLAGRFRIRRLDVDKNWQGSTKIAELILLGELAANVRFRRREDLVVAAHGSFYLAQYLCNKAAVQSGVLQRPSTMTDILLGPAEVIAAIQEELAARFRGPLLEFAAFDLTPPPRGAGLTLLWLLARSPDGFFAVREARLRFPMLAAAFDWLLESNLSRCFREHPSLKGLLYYSRAAATLTMEDPQLMFYLRELDWEEFAEASGHGRVSFHQEDGPIWPSAILLSGISSNGGISSSGAMFSASAQVARRLLHLSDLHFSHKDQATEFYAQLAADLRQQGISDNLDALVVSGDLVNRAEPAEYDVARFFLEKLMEGFSLSSRQVTLVPGNHDVSWTLSQSAYSLIWRSQARSPAAGTFFEAGKDVLDVRDEDAYRRRFQPFSDLYKQIKGHEYPSDYEEQAIFDDPPGSGLLILGLNSAWEIDHHFRDRASIHPAALGLALSKLGPPTSEELRIAVFHHPIHGGEDSRIRDAAFLQQLAVHGFRLVLHGHVHRADAELYRYDRSEEGRQIEVVAAGTFGAPTREWVPGYPLQYNLLLIGADKITVETRARAEIHGAWTPDARWQQGPGKDPLPRYFIER